MSDKQTWQVLRDAVIEASMSDEEVKAAISKAVQRALGGVITAVRNTKIGRNEEQRALLDELESELVEAIEYERKVHAP